MLNSKTQQPGKWAAEDHRPHVPLSRPTTPGIACASCESVDTEVKDSRPQQNYIRRRRRCKNCGHRFTTRESEAPTLDIRSVFLQAQRIVLESQLAADKIKEAVRDWTP